MPSLQLNDQQHFDGSSKLRSHYSDVRDRLRNPASPDAKATDASPAPGVTAGGPAQPISPGVPPEELASIPVEIRDVVARVAEALEMPPSHLLSDLSRPASFGRCISAAIVVRRSQLPPKAIAALFGIAEAMIYSALMTLDAVLAATQASATHAPLVPLIRQVISEWRRFEVPVRARVPIAEVQAAVARVYNVTVDELRSARRSADIVEPRHVAMYLAKRFTLRSLPEIGQAFARDHTTAVHAVKKIQPRAEAIAAGMAPAASIEDWARALRAHMR